MKKSDRMKNMSGKWRRAGAAVMLVCAVAGAMPVYGQGQNSDDATMNFVGADIEAVIKAIGHYANVNFLIDPRVKGTISVISEKPVTKAQALKLLTTALRFQGYAVVTADGYTKVVPEVDAKLQDGPTSISEVKGDQIATQIYHLNYESAANLMAVLRPLITPNNTINADPGNNTLVITDYADNLRRIGRIIGALDVPSNTDLDMVPIKYAVATDIAVMVNRLLEPSAGAGPADGGRVNLIPDARTNSVFIKAPSVARANLAKSLIAKLDQPTKETGNVHVVYLKNADALKLAQTLRAVVSSDSSASSSSGSSSPGLTPQPSPQQNGGQQGGGLGQGQQLGGSSSSSASSLPSGGAAGFIQADQATNTLIITANETVYRNLRAVIDQLDARRAQVYIESLIVEVSAEKSSEFGIQWLSLTGNANSTYRLGGGTSFSTGGDNLLALAAGKGSALPSNGLSLGLFRQIGGQLTLGALAHALESDSNTNILSVPNLITLDNEEANIIVGQNVPFITGQFTTAASAGGAAGGVNPFQTIERKDIGLSLKVKPQISEGGTVKMAIYQESSSIASSTNSAGIITNKRSISTNVLVDDGQIIVLGGLIEDSLKDTSEKVNGLGDIPVLGNLFKYRKRDHAKTNLLVFLRPVVIRNADQNDNVLADRYDYIRNAEIKAQPEHTSLLEDAKAPVLPPLQNKRPQGEGPMLQLDPNAKGAKPVDKSTDAAAGKPTDGK